VPFVRLVNIPDRPVLADVPGSGEKPVTECSDDDLRAIAREWAGRGSGIISYAELLSIFRQIRDEERRRPHRRPTRLIIFPWWDRLTWWIESWSLVRRFTDWRYRDVETQLAEARARRD
jgi:hypothetical protein